MVSYFIDRAWSGLITANYFVLITLLNILFTLSILHYNYVSPNYLFMLFYLLPLLLLESQRTGCSFKKLIVCLHKHENIKYCDNLYSIYSYPFCYSKNVLKAWSDVFDSKMIIFYWWYCYFFINSLVSANKKSSAIWEKPLNWTLIFTGCQRLYFPDVYLCFNK